MTVRSSASDTLQVVSQMTAAWLSNPNTRASAEDVPVFLRLMYDAVCNLEIRVAEPASSEDTAEVYEPATTARKSLSSPDYIISMIDGKRYRTLRRHLSANGLTPAAYRERYGLKADYPMVAPSYSEVRRDMAKKIGLGRSPKGDVEKIPHPSRKSATKRRASRPIPPTAEI